MTKVKTKKVKVTINRNEQMFLSAIAVNQLERAKVEEAGYQFKVIIPSMAFSVFSVEALCNLYGSQLFPHWNHYESTSFIGKIVMISDFLGVQADFSIEPWQTINTMKNFRNSLAHSKPQKVSETHEVSETTPNEFLPFPEQKKSILSYSSIENAEKFQQITTELEMIWMHNARVLGHTVEIVPVREFENVK